MPSKKKKYNARFPAGRIKKIMQTDEDVGKVAQAVPVIISRTLELFVESLLTKSVEVTNRRNAKTLSPSHVKQCILSESRFDFLKDLVKYIPDISHGEEREAAAPESLPSDAGTSANPGPSNVGRPRQPPKRDNGQSSDSGSDHEPASKRPKTYTNGRPPAIAPKPNFDDELKAFVRMTQNKKTEDGNFTVPSTVKTSENNNNKHRVVNYYAETLPDDEEKKPVYSSVIQPNPEYAKNFGFHPPARPDAKENAEAVIPKFHIDLSKGFSMQPAATTAPTYHLDFSAVPYRSHTATTPDPTRKIPPPLQTLRRSASLPDPSPSSREKKFPKLLPKHETKPRAGRNEPPLLLPLNLIKPPPMSAPQMELDEDYDT